jgi:epoxyqueuosine reductase QueG
MVDRMYQQYLIESGQRAETAATADWNPEEVQAEIKAGYHAAMDERRRRQAAEEQAAKMKHLTSIAVQLQKHFARSNLNPAPQNIPY